MNNWRSSCILVPKPDGPYRMSTDYRKVHAVTKSDNYPISRIDDCIKAVGHARYVSKSDLLIGFWQVLLTPRAREISEFPTPDGLFQYKVMPFGTIFTDTWEWHILEYVSYLRYLVRPNLLSIL